jgi:hypothetical protein
MPITGCYANIYAQMPLNLDSQKYVLAYFQSISFHRLIAWVLPQVSATNKIISWKRRL